MWVANDNISAFIEPGEMDELVKEVCEKMAGVLESLVIDTEHDHNTQETARRVAKMYVTEVFRGRYVPLPKVTEFPERRASERTHDHGAGHRAQRLQPSLLSHHGPAVDRRDA